MRKRFLLAAFLLGVVGSAWVFWPGKSAIPLAPSVIAQMRDVARLNTLELSLYKKISFAPDPQSTSVWAWVRQSLLPPEGRAIIFARAHVGFDLTRLDERHVRVVGDTIVVTPPPLQVTIEILPGETEIIGSNLDSAQTAQLFAHARDSFAQDVEHDAMIKDRAQQSLRAALESLLYRLGFAQVKIGS